MRYSVRDLTMGALAAALVAAFAFLPPVALAGPVPIVMQNLAVMLVGLLLPRRAVLLGMITFVLLVAVGAPVLTGGKGGFAFLMGPTAGFIFSWVAAGYLEAWVVERFGRTLLVCLVAAGVGGVGVVYLGGVPVLKLVTGMSWNKALVAGMYPFIVGDLVKAVAAALVAVAVGRRLYGVPQRGNAGRAA